MLSWFLQSYLQQTARERIRAAVEEAARRGSGQERDEEAVADEPPPAPRQLAILCASEAEAGGIVDQLEDLTTTETAHSTEYLGRFAERDVVVVQTGPGAVAARLAVEEALTLYQPPWVIAAGFATGLAPQVGRRHVVMPAEVVSEGGARLSVGFQIDPALAASMKSLHTGPLVTLEKPLATPEEKRQAAERHGAIAADAETFAIADACRNACTRFLAVRVIVDAVDDRLPPDVDRLLKQKSLAGQVGAGLATIWNRFSAVGDLWQLQEDAVRSTDTLARFLAGVAPQLAPPPPHSKSQTTLPKE